MTNDQKPPEEPDDDLTPEEIEEEEQLAAEERESIWSVPRRLRRWYAAIFVVQYLIFLGLTIYDVVVNQPAAGLVATILAVQRGMTANILNIAASAYATLEVYMLADWLREWDRNRFRKSRQQARESRRQAQTERQQREQTAQRAETAEKERQQESARATAAEKALQEARAEANHQWQARQQAAFQAGIPFDEPPPFPPANDNGTENPNSR